MARITVEDCLDNESNRFSLVMLAARRAKQLLSGNDPVTDTKGNKAIVSALREIADGKVRFGDEEVEAQATEESVTENSVAEEAAAPAAAEVSEPAAATAASESSEAAQGQA